MATTKPGRGTIANQDVAAMHAAQAAAAQRSARDAQHQSLRRRATRGKGGAGGAGSKRTGSWRPDTPFTAGSGLHVTLRHEPGVTGDVLRVPFRFQVPPIGDFSRSYQVSWATYDTLRAGQRSRPTGEQLLELQINTMLMDGFAADGSSGVVVWDEIADPQGMLDELLWIAGRPKDADPQVFRLIVNQPAVWGSVKLVNVLAAITSLEPKQVPGEPGTEYLALTFLEVHEDQVERRQLAKPGSTGKYTVKAGDTLYKIATHSYHRASMWRLIAKANGIKGVSPNSAAELAKWLKAHHRTDLKIPPVVLQVTQGAHASGGVMPATPGRIS